MKIAHIAPARRMPKGLGYLTYIVPDHLESIILPGQLVTIELRKSHVYGIVFSIEESHIVDDRLKHILDIVQPIPLCSDIVRQTIDAISELYGVSIGTATKLFLPPLQKRKLSSVALQPILPTPREEPIQHTYRHYQTPSERDSILNSSVQGTSLIVTPDNTQIAHIESLFPNKRVITWHGDLSQKEQFARWFDIRNGNYDIIVGSRSSLFLPFASLTHILIDEEQSSQHKQWEGHPLYATHDIVPILGKLYHAHITKLSYSPRFETYFDIAKKHIHTPTDTMEAIHTPITGTCIIPMNDERKGGNDAIFAESIVHTLQTARSDSLIYVQRKGYATAATCHNCTYTARCNHCGMAEIFYKKTKSLKCHYCKTSRKIPLLCPDCNKETLSLYGVGTEQVMSYLQQQSLVDTQLVRIDGNIDETDQIIPDKKIIYVGTEAVLKKIDWSRITNIIWFDIDAEIQYPDFRASEGVWHRLKEFQYRAPNATIYIQTTDPSQLLLRSLAEPERLYRTELHGRQALKFPPYTTLVRCSTGGASSYAAEREAERVFSILSRILTTEGIQGDISYPISTYPTLHRGRYWYTILLKLQPTTWTKDLARLTAELPSSWRIDPSPQSLLSP